MKSNQGLSSEEILELAMTVGTHKKNRPLSPIEAARRIKILIDSGKTKQEIATLLASKLRKPGSTDTSMIKQFLDIYKLPEEYHDQISFGGGHRKIGITSAYELSKLGDKKVMRELLDQIYINQLTKKEVILIAQYYKKYNTSGKTVPIKEIVKKIVGRRPIIEEMEVLVGIIHPEIRKKILHLEDKELLTLKRNITKELSSKINIGKIYEINIRQTNFYIIVDKDFKNELYKLCNNQENKIVTLINQVMINKLIR